MPRIAQFHSQLRFGAQMIDVHFKHGQLAVPTRVWRCDVRQFLV